MQSQQFAAAADEAGGRRFRDRAAAGLQAGQHVLPRLRGRAGAEQLRVVFFLEQHRHEPVFQAQFAGAEHAAAACVVFQRALPGQHRGADALAVGQGLVKRFDEAAGGFDQHRMAHGDDGGDADFQQFGGDGFGSLLGLRGLAGFQEHQRDAVFAQQGAEFVGVNRLVAALFQLVQVLRVFKAQAAQADLAVVDAVAVEMHDMVRLAGAAGAGQFGAQGGQRRRV